MVRQAVRCRTIVVLVTEWMISAPVSEHNERAMGPAPSVNAGAEPSKVPA
jgi:hypothetical protein